jgi:hypothetical protein
VPVAVAWPWFVSCKVLYAHGPSEFQSDVQTGTVDGPVQERAGRAHMCT